MGRVIKTMNLPAAETGGIENSEVGKPDRPL